MKTILDKRVLVIGDAMLDTYVHGDVTRISPEAPIPVICPQKKEYRVGGAANVACNAAMMGAHVSAVFVLGQDAESEIMLEMLRALGIETSLICRDTAQHTIQKLRIIGKGQQILRIDLHDSYILTPEMEKRILQQIAGILDKQDAVVISDYGKGICTETFCRAVIQACRQKGKTVIVDPKGNDWEKYCGATVITPNMNEINLYCGTTVANEDDKIEHEFRGLTNALGIDYLLITRSERGMSLLSNSETVHFPALAQEVSDVSGAGDTVVAALASVLSENRYDILRAVQISNVAAGIAAGKQGTALVSRKEIEYYQTQCEDKRNVFTLQDYDGLMDTVQKWREAGNRIVTANGCFDIIHIGHIRLLEAARSMGNRLIVAINSDSSVRRLKGKDRPINTEMARAQLLSKLRMVDAVVIFDANVTPYVLSEQEREHLSPKAIESASEAPMALMSMLRPDIHVKGGDYRPEDVPEALFANELRIFSVVEGYSTTNIISHLYGLKKGSVEAKDAGTG